MAYEIFWSEVARNSLRKLESDISQRILLKLRSVRESPHNFVERLSGKNFYKLRVGDYRVILDIDEANKKIFIRLAGHRKNIYKILARAL